MVEVPVGSAVGGTSCRGDGDAVEIVGRRRRGRILQLFEKFEGEEGIFVNSFTNSVF
jgi:hypothetical protein